MKKQEFTTRQERKLKFVEAGVLFALILGLTVFIGAKVINRDSGDELTAEDSGSVVTIVEESAPVAVAEHPDEMAAAEAAPVEIEATSEPQPESAPEPVSVSYGEAEAAYLDRDYVQAARLFNIYTRDHRANAWGHYMLGLSEWKAGDLDAAEEAFLAALEIKPDHVKSLVNYGRVLLELDHTDEARAQIELALAADTEGVDARRVLGRIQHTEGELDAAAENFRTVLRSRDDDAWSLNSLGLIRIEQGRYEEAVAPLAKAAGLKPTVACIQNNLGVALERTGHFGAAVEAFTAALDADPSYGKAEISLARVKEQEDAHGSDPIDLMALADEFAVDQVADSSAAAETADSDLSARDMEVAAAALSAEVVAEAEEESEAAEAAAMTGEIPGQGEEDGDR